MNFVSVVLLIISLCFEILSKWIMFTVCMYIKTYNFLCCTFCGLILANYGTKSVNEWILSLYLNSCFLHLYILISTIFFYWFPFFSFCHLLNCKTNANVSKIYYHFKHWVNVNSIFRYFFCVRFCLCIEVRMI